MAVERGELVVRRRQNKPPLIQVRIGDKPPMNVAAGEVSQSLLDRLDELNGQVVEFERVGGQPKQVREVGGAFVRAAGSGAVASGGRGRDPSPRAPAPQRGSGAPPSRGGGRQADSHNPYNFVPAPQRNTADPVLGDHRPVAQDAFDPDRFSGRIRVRMAVQTPLLVPDTGNVEESANGHKTYPLRVGADGKPAIPASSVRGMLRSAYETITNSRYGRLSSELRDRLALRMDARKGLRLIPARIENGQVHLLTGTSTVGQDGGLGHGDPQYAAWLPRYGRDGQVAQRAVRYPTGGLPGHGDEVECWIERFRHYRWDRWQNVHVADFEYWSVRVVVRAGGLLGSAPGPSNARPRSDRQSWHEPIGQQMVRSRGWVCVTNANINRKHDERVFFGAAGSTAPGPFPLSAGHRAMWRELIQNYQSIHEDDLCRRDRNRQAYDQYLGREPGQTAWSRHVYTASDREIEDGTLCYVRLDEQRMDVEAIFPVMIARELYPASPWDLLDGSVRPAETIDQLSPADRVFGWVRTAGGGPTSARPRGEPIAVRGLLRVGPVTCTSAVADAVETFPSPGVPLAILSTPKPQQGRFYIARTPNGEAQNDGLSKTDAGYAPGKGLRGRKVYPHQASLPAGYWDSPTADRTQTGIGSPAHYQEYRRPLRDGQEQRDDQNRSMLGWVKTGAEFRFDVHVHNLSHVELGALLWLLSLPDEHYLRFGGGKPLGFGSVRLTLEECDVRTGQALRARYAGWTAGAPATDHRQASIQAFQDAVLSAYPLSRSGSRFDDVPFLRAFLAACRGCQDSLPVHYPRATDDGYPGPPSPEGESFRWFVANERSEARHALHYLATDDGLPTLASDAGSSGGGPGRPGHGGPRGGAGRRGT